MRRLSALALANTSGLCGHQEMAVMVFLCSDMMARSLNSLYLWSSYRTEGNHLLFCKRIDMYIRQGKAISETIRQFWKWFASTDRNDQQFDFNKYCRMFWKTKYFYNVKWNSSKMAVLLKHLPGKCKWQVLHSMQICRRWQHTHLYSRAGSRLPANQPVSPGTSLSGDEKNGAMIHSLNYNQAFNKGLVPTKTQFENLE